MEECLSEAFEFAKSLKRAYDNVPQQDRKRVNDRHSECESMEEAPGASTEYPLLSPHELEKDPKSTSSSSNDKEETTNGTARDGLGKATPENGFVKQQGSASSLIHTLHEDDASNAKATAEDNLEAISQPACGRQQSYPDATLLPHSEAATTTHVGKTAVTLATALKPPPAASLMT